MRAPHSKRVNKASKNSTASKRPKDAQHADKYADVPYDRAAIRAALEKNEFAKGNTAGGRKPPYKPEYAEVAKLMCARGATIEQLAQHIGVSADTIRMWQVTHQEFFEACKLDEKAGNEHVKRSMFESALESSLVTERSIVSSGQTQTVKSRVNLPANFSAGRFFLLNRARNEWSTQHEKLPIVQPEGELAALLKEINGSRLLMIPTKPKGS